MSSKGTILVVDDTHASLKLMTDILTKEGYQVRPADSGELALESVAFKQPELILMDILMPGLDGYEVLRRLKARQESRDIPIIFLSAVTEVKQRVEGLKLGAVDFISKPFQREELLARVQTHMELHRLRIRLEQQAMDLRLVNAQLGGEIAERKRAEEALREKVEELRQALDQIKTLRGIVPICSSCKKIRDDQGYWNQVEVYVRDHTEAEFTHSICPECARKLYPEMYKNR